MRGAPLRAGLLAAAAVVGCADSAEVEPAGALRVEPLASPAGPGSGQPSLTVDADGRALLSWIESGDDSATLFLARLEGATWSAPNAVAAGRDFIVNWADFPTVAPLDGGRLAAHWLVREGADTYAYGVRMAFSDDDGATWSEPIRPHTDSTETEHGFVSLLPAGDGTVHAVWLDGREFAAGREEMTLRSARVGPGTIADETVVDARICDCCQTDAAMGSHGALVVYRDRTEGEIRDIAIVRSTGAGWTEPRIVHPDDWHIDGCPVNGPAVAALGELVAVAWFTAARDTAKVQLALSRDGGATFAAPIRIDQGDPAGRVDVVLVDEHTALVSWVEDPGGAGAEVRLRPVSLADASAGPATTVAAIRAERASGFPRMALAGDALVIAWTDSEAGVVRTARAHLGSAE